jgi:8-oxo-dGTP pyrophosphatase MutT (NUDIX family)
MAKARIQKSAGGVIYQEREGQMYVTLIATKRGVSPEGSLRRERWGLPKGIVERGEGSAQTALREVAEETGLEGEIVGKLGYIEYWFRSPEDKILYHKFVDFYLLEYRSGEVEKHDWEVEEARWFPIEEAIERISFENERDILRKAKEEWERKRDGDLIS